MLLRIIFNHLYMYDSGDSYLLELWEMALASFSFPCLPYLHGTTDAIA